MKNLHIGLINNRHEIKEATDGFLFDSIELNDMAELINVLPEMSAAAVKNIIKKAGVSCYISEEHADLYKPIYHTDSSFIIYLYATGLTPVLLSVIEELRRYDGCHLVVKHYDRNLNGYVRQLMF